MRTETRIRDCERNFKIIFKVEIDGEFFSDNCDNILTVSAVTDISRKSCQGI